MGKQGWESGGGNVKGVSIQLLWVLNRNTCIKLKL